MHPRLMLMLDLLEERVLPPVVPPLQSCRLIRQRYDIETMHRFFSICISTETPTQQDIASLGPWLSAYLMEYFREFRSQVNVIRHHYSEEHGVDFPIISLYSHRPSVHVTNAGAGGYMIETVCSMQGAPSEQDIHYSTIDVWYGHLFPFEALDLLPGLDLVVAQHGNERVFVNALEEYIDQHLRPLES